MLTETKEGLDVGILVGPSALGQSKTLEEDGGCGQVRNQVT